MTNAPERIWIDAERTYSATSFSAGIPYVRADLFDALTAERDAALALVAAAYEVAARKATGFLVGKPENGVPLRNPMAHEIAKAIRALAPADALAAQAARDERMRAEGAKAAEARLEEMRVTEFNRGYLIACCNLTNLHDRPELASDVLMAAGIVAAEVKAMNLTDYDAKALRKIRKARGDDPIARAALRENGDE